MDKLNKLACSLAQLYPNSSFYFTVYGFAILMDSFYEKNTWTYTGTVIYN